MPLSHPNSPRDHAPYPHPSHALGPSSVSALSASTTSTSTAELPHNGSKAGAREPASKGAKGDKSADGAAGGKGRKRPPSCNLCRIRKVKCIRDEPTARCESCIALNRTCEYGPSRRPGPVSRYARPSSNELEEMAHHRPSHSSAYHQYDPSRSRSSRSPPPRARDPDLAYPTYPPPPLLQHSHSHGSHAGAGVLAHMAQPNYASGSAPPPQSHHAHSHSLSQHQGYPPPQSAAHHVTPSTSDPDRRPSSHSTPSQPQSHRHGSFDFPIYPPPLSGPSSGSLPGSGAGGMPPPLHSHAHQHSQSQSQSTHLPPFDTSFPIDAVSAHAGPSTGAGAEPGLDWLGLPISPYSSMLYSAGLGEGLGVSPQRTTYSVPSVEGVGSAEQIGSGSMAPPHAPAGSRGYRDGGGVGDRGEGDDAAYGGRRRVGSAQGTDGRKKESSRNTSVEDVVAWSVVMRILDAYHINLYPLMPIVHWPTFLQLLISREDERNIAWRAMLLSLIAYSIIQLPRPVLAFIDVRDLRRLHQKCHALSHAQRNHEYTTISVVDLTTLYCEHIYLSTMGRQNAANGVLAQAIRLSQALNLHDDRLDTEGDCVEREVRRRVFWLLYGSDRTISALTGCPLHFSESDIHLPLPLAVDDNLITASGAFPQAPHITSILAGFHYASRLFHLLGAVLTAQHSLPSAPSLDRGPGTENPAVLGLPPLQAPVRPATQFQDALESILGDLPDPLRLTLDGWSRAAGAGGAGPGGAGAGVGGEGSSAMQSTSSGSGTVAGASRPADKGPGGQGPQATAFEICKANLLVSQAMVRFAIQQYAVAIGEDWDDLHGQEWTEKNVLNMLESMSSESLAANGESLRHKILSFVASSFLDRYPLGQRSSGTSESHTLFLEFLGLYDRIREVQQAAELEAPESRRPSRAATPAGMAMSSIMH